MIFKVLSMSISCRIILITQEFLNKPFSLLCQDRIWISYLPCGGISHGCMNSSALAIVISMGLKAHNSLLWLFVKQFESEYSSGEELSLKFFVITMST